MKMPHTGAHPDSQRDAHPIAAAEKAVTVRPFTVRLPGFVADEQIGLGDAVRRVTATLGLRACGACDRRAATLNRWIVFAGQRKG